MVMEKKINKNVITLTRKKYVIHNEGISSKI